MFTTMTHGSALYKLESGEERSTGERVSSIVEELSKVMDQKASSPGYRTVMRILTSASTQRKADEHLENVIGAFAQFSDIRSNVLLRTRVHDHRRLIADFIRRFPRRRFWWWMRRPRCILSSLELAGFFHLPSIQYNKVPTIKWQNFKIVPVPKNVPDSPEAAGDNPIKLGSNVHRGQKTDIYLKHNDRFRHFYIIGQTGTGKSTMIITLAEQDFRAGNGCCVIDPHGSLVEELLTRIPRERADDVIYFNPADTERPMGLNMLEGKTDEERDLIALDAMNMMVKMFGEEIFGPRIQDYFRNGCLTLMADEEEGGRNHGPRPPLHGRRVAEVQDNEGQEPNRARLLGKTDGGNGTSGEGGDDPLLCGEVRAVHDEYVDSKHRRPGEECLRFYGRHELEEDPPHEPEQRAHRRHQLAAPRSHHSKQGPGRRDAQAVAVR